MLSKFGHEENEMQIDRPHIPSASELQNRSLHYINPAIMLSLVFSRQG